VNKSIFTYFHSQDIKHIVIENVDKNLKMQNQVITNLYLFILKRPHNKNQQTQERPLPRFMALE
tara:strand:+ start:897 stop:1088 length:192 start_codon:yes stop_codon:yes gene_type:complete